MRADPLGDAVAADFAQMDRGESRALLNTAIERGIDAVPDAPVSLVTLFDQLDHVPVWIDWSRIERAGDVLFRAGLVGGTVLGAKALATAYCSAAGNKPLVFSGQLQHRDRIGYRLAETSRFVVDVCQRGGMRRFGPGFATTVRVRIMHAAVRRLIEVSGDFDHSAWGSPINQHDMVGTTLLFSLAFTEGVRAFGFEVTDEEVDDFLHLWRYNGYVIGIEPELLPATVAEGARIAEVIQMTQGDPDDDSRALVHALVHSPLYAAGDDADAVKVAHRQVALGYGFTRVLLGDSKADELDLPRDSTRFVLPAVARALRPIERVGRRVPGYDAKLIRAGHTYWEQAIALGLAGKSAEFIPPAMLAGLSDAASLASRLVR